MPEGFQEKAEDFLKNISDKRVRKIIGFILEVIDNQYDGDSDKILSNLVCAGVITPEFADFVLELKYRYKHFHLIRSAQYLWNDPSDKRPIFDWQTSRASFTIFCGKAVWNNLGAVPVKITRNGNDEVMVLVGNLQKFDSNKFKMYFEPLANVIMMSEDERKLVFSPFAIRVCHEEALMKFCENVNWVGANP